MLILYSCHQRSKKRLKESELKLTPKVIQHESLGFYDYNNLLMNAFAVVSDSGTLPEALDKVCFILALIDELSLLHAVETAVVMNKDNNLGILVPDYIEENVSTKVVKLIRHILE